MIDPQPQDFRQLRRIKLPVGETGLGDPDDPTHVAVVVDVETTGLDIENDKIIELALRRFRYRGDVYRDQSFVYANCINLARKLKSMVEPQSKPSRSGTAHRLLPPNDSAHEED